MNPDFATLNFDEHVIPAIISGTVASGNLSNYWMGIVAPDIGKASPESEWIGVPFPAVSKGQELTRRSTLYSMSSSISISGATDQPEACVKLIDWLYSDDGVNMAWWGTPGVTYEMGDDGPRFLESAIDPATGTCTGYVNCVYATNEFRLLPNKRGNEWATSPFQIDAERVWLESCGVSSLVPPGPIYTIEESNRRSALYSDISTYANESFLNFVMGNRSLTEYDAYVEDLKAMGIEEVIAIWQAAYDRYLQR